MDAREVGERIVRVEEQLRNLQGDVEALDRQISGPPREESIRGRLHKLENADAAARAATAALAAAKAVQRQGWSQRERVGLFVIAAAGVVLGVVQLFWGG